MKLTMILFFFLESPVVEEAKMSTPEEVKTEAPPAEIIPAKSEDKLEIEKEEAEKKVEEIMEEVEKEKTEDDKPKEDEKEEKEEKEGETEKVDEAKESGETVEEEKKRFKLKTPKVPGFLRGKSKEREKQKVRDNRLIIHTCAIYKIKNIYVSTSSP